MRLNNRYTIVLKDPLCRPGLSIQTEVSEKYVVETGRRMLEMVRELNTPLAIKVPKGIKDKEF